MTKVVTCYQLKGKAKSEMLCRAFAQGVRAAGGEAFITDGADRLQPGAAVFYGVRPHQKPLLDAAIAEGRDYYYIDNAYFDATREKYFRITKNRLQHGGIGESDGVRFAALGLHTEAAWRARGEHVLLCPQSDEFLDLFCPQGRGWTDATLALLRQRTGRELRVRAWQSDKVAWYRTLPQDLTDCFALVTFSSASAITAMMHGVPAFVTGRDCISLPVANLDVDRIERPRTPTQEAFAGWLNVVADHQFTISEIMSGRAWRRLQSDVTASADRGL